MKTYQTNRTRMWKDFQKLTSIDSLSFREREFADVLAAILKDMGMEVKEDRAGEDLNGTAGNIYGYLKGDLQGNAILFSAHMDTVEPGIGKKAILTENDTILSETDTVLGADDVSGIVEILEGIRAVKESGKAHRDIELLFPVAEEVYIKGTNHMVPEWISAKEAYVLDMSGKIGTAAYQAPTLISFSVQIDGRAAHAGFEPEKGVHAIAIAAKAIDALQLGHVDEETTLNVGMIQGGAGTNIVPELCICRGEIRSFSHEKALDLIRKVEQTFSNAAADLGGSARTQYCIDLYAYRVESDDPVITHFLQACHAVGREGKLTTTLGGSDNNNFARHGISGLVLSSGYEKPHTTEEYCSLDEMELGARLVAELITQQI